MRWKKEYIRLMTMFEVIVEIDADQILIPSHLPSKVMSDPFLVGSEFMVREACYCGVCPVDGEVAGWEKQGRLGQLCWTMLACVL